MTRKSQLARRGAVIVGVRAGRSDKEISEFNKILINTVRNIIRRHYEVFLGKGGNPDDYDINRNAQKRRSDALQP